jgi:LPS export ABC transporter protein LptC
MINNPRNILWIVPLLLLLTSPLWKSPLAAFLAPRGGYSPQLAQPENESPTQDFIMDAVTITLTSKGQAEWQIDAERASTGGQDHEIEMVGVNARYIGTDKEPTQITSRKGNYSIDQRHLVLTDQVVISKPTKNQQLLSDQLDYYDATKMVVSPGKVDLQGPGLKVTAGRMDYDLSTGGYDFSNRVKVKL